MFEDLFYFQMFSESGFSADGGLSNLYDTATLLSRLLGIE
jgi:hypothetical protein